MSEPKQRGRWSNETRNQIRYNLYQAYGRGMSKEDLQRAFGLSEDKVDELLDEQILKSYEDKKGQDVDMARAMLLDEIRDDIATCYTQISELEKKAAEQDKGMSKEQLASFVSLQSTIRGHRKLYADVLGLTVNRVTGADGKGPIEISSTDDRDKLEREVLGLLGQFGIKELPAPEVIDGETD